MMMKMMMMMMMMMMLIRRYVLLNSARSSSEKKKIYKNNDNYNGRQAGSRVASQQTVTGSRARGEMLSKKVTIGKNLKKYHTMVLINHGVAGDEN